MGKNKNKSESNEPLNDIEFSKSPWRKYREELSTQKTEIERQSDKIVFTISTGAIGVSLVIIDKLSPSAEYNYLYFLLSLSWICLIISIIIQAISFNKTSKKIANSIESIDKIIGAVSISQLTQYEAEYHTKWREENRSITKTGAFAIRLMIAGIILLLVFSFLSIYLGKGTKTEEQKEVKSSVQK